MRSTAPPNPPPTVNRRMDEWVSLENLDLNTVILPEPVDAADK